MFAGLGRDTALFRAIDPAGGAWGNTEELLATVAELVDYGNRNFLRANFQDGGKAKPIRITRPGKQQREQQRGTTLDEFRSMMRSF